MSDVEQTEETLSQAEIARLAGCSPGAVSLVFNKHRNPGLSLAKRIASAMSLSLDEFYRRLNNGELKSEQARRRRRSLADRQREMRDKFRRLRTSGRRLNNGELKSEQARRRRCSLVHRLH